PKLLAVSAAALGAPPPPLSLDQILLPLVNAEPIAPVNPPVPAIAFKAGENLVENILDIPVPSPVAIAEDIPIVTPEASPAPIEVVAAVAGFWAPHLLIPSLMLTSSSTILFSLNSVASFSAYASAASLAASGELS